jgi:hypothetical protein
MSFLDEILDENAGAGEAAAMRRGNSDAYYRRQQAKKPRMMASQAAGQWGYVPVNVRSGSFSKWNPPARRSDMSGGAKINIGVRSEDVDPVAEVTDRIDNIVSALFSEEY